MASITFDGVGKEFPDGTVALAEFDLDVSDGELMVLVGPSGSGKSTALRIVAGLEDPSAGEVRIGDRVVNDVQPKDRDIAMVFQSYALYPHMSVQGNLGFPLKMRGEEKTAVASSVTGTAERLDIGGLLVKRPAQLSGGQRQRVALGRAMVRDPLAFLMDEPLSNLDAKLRVEMRAYVSQLHRRLGKTMLYVTHDQVEAMTMGDRVAVMRDGHLEQVDTPQALYDRPASLFVAGFIGSPGMNLLRGCVADDGAGEPALRLGAARLPLADASTRRHAGVAGLVGRDVVVGVRPEALTPTESDDGRPTLEGTVTLVESLGSDLLIRVDIGAAPPDSADAEPNGSVPRSGELTARVEPSFRTAVGETVRLGVDPGRLHFFDPTGGRAL
jgi:multiple sugar transport system ATP-binding protein